MAEEYRCFVGGLAWTTDSIRLEGAFKPYGQVIESKVVNDRDTGRSRGFGFVTFSDEKSMRDAIDYLNGSELDGRNITVNQAQSRGSGGGGGGGGGSYRSENGGGYSNSGSRYGGSRDGGYGRSTSDSRGYGGSRNNGFESRDGGFGSGSRDAVFRGSRDGSYGGSRGGGFGGSRGGDSSSKTWRSQRNNEF